jgi:cysteine desulfurase/selenocysteine lyase
MRDSQKLRRDFPILKRRIHGKQLAYLDNGATSQKPKQVLASMQDYYTRHNANVHRGIHTLSEEATTAYEDARKTIAAFIGAQPNELIFVRNTTEAINLVTWTWGLEHLREGGVILTTEMEHHSNIVPWQQLAKYPKVKLAFVRVDPKTFTLDLADLKAKLKLRPKLVCVTHASNVLGTINPIAEITQLAHKAGAKVLVDGAQSVPHFPVDVRELKCDFLAFSGHKMLGPMGIGGLYVKREILETMGPFLTGGGMIAEVYKDHSVFAELPERYDAGTPNVAGALGLAAAVNYLKKVGMEQVWHHEQELVDYTLEKLTALPGLTVYGPQKNRGGVIAFTLKEVHAHDVAQILDQEGVAVRSGHHCCMILHQEVLRVPATTRASLYLYNTKTEIDRLVEGLKKVKQIFR